MKTGDSSQLAASNYKIDFSKLVPVDMGKKKLGTGAYASVKLVKDTTSGLQYALKEVCLDLLDRPESSVQERPDKYRTRDHLPSENRSPEHHQVLRLSEE